MKNTKASSCKSAENNQNFLVEEHFCKNKTGCRGFARSCPDVHKPRGVRTTTYMNKPGSLYRDIAHLSVENTEHWVPGVQGSKRTHKKTSCQSNLIRKINMHMTCAEAASCVQKNIYIQDQKVWTKLHATTLKIRCCYKYMISSPQDQNGIIMFGNGDVYQGCIKNSTASRDGCYFFSNGDILHGLFENRQASSSMVYKWYNTDTVVIEYKDWMIERWVQLCVDNDVYEVCGHHWIESSSSMSSGCSLTLSKTRSLPLTRRHAPKDLSPSGFQMFVE